MYYYLDSREGDDSADGRSPQTAWRSLAKANTRTFAPGDSLLLRRGCSWLGETLAPRGSGTPEAPILIDAYGEGEQPLIDRRGGFSETENATEAVCLTNQSDWIIRHLTVSNTNPAPRSGDCPHRRWTGCRTPWPGRGSHTRCPCGDRCRAEASCA